MKFPNQLRHWRELRKKTQQDLADALSAAGIKGAKKQKIWKIESGIQRITPQELAIFADLLKCEMGELILEIEKIEEKSNISPFPEKINQPLTEMYVNDMVPVYGNPSGGLARISEVYVVSKTLRHPGIANVKGSFAMYVDGDSMAPRRFHGEMVYIHPFNETLPGKDCVVVLEPHGELLYRLFVGKTKDGKGVIVRQFSPEKEMTILRKNIKRIYSVVF